MALLLMAAAATEEDMEEATGTHRALGASLHGGKFPTHSSDSPTSQRFRRLSRTTSSRIWSLTFRWTIKISGLVFQPCQHLFLEAFSLASIHDSSAFNFSASLASIRGEACPCFKSVVGLHHIESVGLSCRYPSVHVLPTVLIGSHGNSSTSSKLHLPLDRDVVRRIWSMQSQQPHRFLSHSAFPALSICLFDFAPKADTESYATNHPRPMFTSKA